MRRAFANAGMILLAVVGVRAALAAETVGQIAFVQGDKLLIKSDARVTLQEGDQLEVFVELPGIGEAQVATAAIKIQLNSSAIAKVQQATGKVKPGQKVRVLATAKAGSNPAAEHPGPLSVLEKSRPSSSEQVRAVAEFESLRFGMFLHFGIATFVGENRSGNQLDPSLYAPAKLDVDQWARTASRAGMKYLVLSVSHPGDGNFCLWDADDEYCVRRSGNKTDVVAALGQACGRYGIKLGVFYYPGLIPSYDKALMQVVELCDKYPAISQFRFHVQKKFDSLGRVDVYRVVKKTNPNCLVQQTGNGTPPALLEAAFPADVLGGFNLPPTKPFDPQLRFAGRDYYIPYEYLTSIFSGPNTWFYGEGVELRPANELFELYRECRESRCNFLLGMGPDRTGLIPEDQVARLMQLKAKIDAVYSAR